MTVAEDRAARERQQRLSDFRWRLAIKTCQTLVRHWHVSLPAFCWLIFLVERSFGRLLFAALVTWGCIVLRRRGAGLAVFRSGEDGRHVELRRSWPAIAEQAKLTGVRAPRSGWLPETLNVLIPAEPRLTPPPIVRIEDTPLGAAMTVQMHPGQVVKDYSRAAEVMANMWRVPSVRVTQPAGTDTVVLTRVTEDPLGRTYQVTPDALPPMASLKGVEVGRQEDGQPWVFPVLESHAVVGGVPGSGKSVFANVVLAGLAQRPDVQIVGIDCAGGVELSDWAPRLSALATSQEEAIDALQALWEEHERRIEWLKAHGYKSLANAGFSEEMPLYVAVIDEAAQLFRLESPNKEDKARGSQLVDLVTRLITVSRKTGIVVILATQKPTTNTLPSLCRDNAQVKVAFRVTTAEAAKSILGDSASVAPVPPTAIRRDQKGVAIAEGADGELTVVRSYYIDEESDRAIAQAYAHLARPLTTTGTERTGWPTPSLRSD